MAFESGKFALTIFELQKKLPENYIELFAARNAGKLDEVKDEPVTGWVSGRHLLETRIDEQTGIIGGHLCLNMRTAERKIPSALLKAICQREELAYMEANDMPSVPSKIRREIKASALETHLMKMPPNISSVPFVVDMASDMLYLGTGSMSQVDNFLAFFLQTTEVEPVQINVDELMLTMFKKTTDELPSITFSDSAEDDEPSPPRDFLTWLWYFSETEGAKVTCDKYGDFELGIEGPLTFAFTAETRGAGESTVKKGSPLRSAEAKAAMEVGKKLRKAKLVIARGKDMWAGSFDADKFAFSGLSLPEGEEMDRQSRFVENINFLHIFQSALKAYFKKFVETLTGPEWPAEEKKIRKWVAEREYL